MLRCLAILIILVTTAGAQVQEFEVLDFSGGLAPGLANSLMQPNQAIDLSNYMVTQFGSLKRRPGMSVHYPDAQSDSDLDAVIPFHGPKGKSVLLRRLQTTRYSPDSAFVSLIQLCNDAQEVCTATVYAPMYYSDRNPNLPFNWTATTINDRLVIASTKSELILWDGDSLMPARAVAPGQLSVMAMDGAGDVNGKYTYKYWCNHIDLTPDDTSLLSPPSWEVSVHNGKVLIVIPPREEAGCEYHHIFRKKDTWDLYLEVDSIATSATENYYIDSLSDDDIAGTESTHLWGDDLGGQFGHLPDYTKPPGGIDIDSTGGVASIFDGCGTCDSIGQIFLGYSLVFVDSAGRESYHTVPSFYVANTGSSADSCSIDWSLALTNIPTNAYANITAKYVLRRWHADFHGPAENFDSIQQRWWLVDTLDDTTTTWTDTMNYLNNGVLWCEETEENSSSTLSPENGCYDDSTIVFQPTSLVFHGSRAYAIGNWHHPNYLYYSEFGRPTTWGPDRFLSMPSQQGDWLVHLLTLSTNNLIMFRQNSVMGLQGTTWFQYSVDQVKAGVGLTARGTLVRDNSNIFFAHISGMYVLGNPVAISEAIQPIVDSVGDKMQRSVAAMVGQELWWSVAVVAEKNDRTLVFSPRPKAHWTQYSFGLESIALHDYDTTQVDYVAERYLLSTDLDSLWRWNYNNTDSLDGADTIIAEYQSPYFFEGGGRDHILWIDILGTGEIDSLMLTFYRNYGETKPGVPFDSLVLRPDFSDAKRDRAIVGAICENFSLRIRDYGMGDYTLKGFKIGYIPWDGGKP